MGRIKAIITDFDGTLVNTFKANYYAYKEAFIQYGYELTEEQYKECYGLRYDNLCDKMNIKQDDRNPIKELKKKMEERKKMMAKMMSEEKKEEPKKEEPKEDKK